MVDMLTRRDLIRASTAGLLAYATGYTLFAHDSEPAAAQPAPEPRDAESWEFERTTLTKSTVSAESAEVRIGDILAQAAGVRVHTSQPIHTYKDKKTSKRYFIVGRANPPEVSFDCLRGVLLSEPPEKLVIKIGDVTYTLVRPLLIECGLWDFDAAGRMTYPNVKYIGHALIRE